MTQQKLKLINEQTSPLFRIMSVYNIDEPTRRIFDNNISAFHIGNGLVLSVAHNLRSESLLIRSISNELYQTHIWPLLNIGQRAQVDHLLPLDPVTNKRYLTVANQNEIQILLAIFRGIAFDSRWIALTELGICKPHLIIQFTGNMFYDSQDLTNGFSATRRFHEPELNRHTFLLEVELVEAFYAQDIAIYRIINAPQAIIERLPKLNLDYTLLPDGQHDYYCLQSSPGSLLGRLLNKAQIEGYLDHHSTFQDRFAGNYVFEGMRYLIRGYFRFGSSGAPYVVFNHDTEQFSANAIQSEACPIQLAIGNNREGNFQYVNALATPLRSVEARINHYLTGQG